MFKRLIKTIRKRLINNFLEKENIYKFSDKKLKYVFLKKKKSNKLVVIFSGFPAKNKPPVYNYIFKLMNLNCNKLYILDDFGYDNRGSYYLGKSSDFFISKAVTDLIDIICHENNIKYSNVITFGSSKGGFAALFFAFKNKYGAAIAGEPQIALGDYLSTEEHIDIYEYVVGSESQENTKYLNNLLYELVDKNKSYPRIYIHSGKGNHFTNHLNPFIDYLDSENIDYTLDLQNYYTHDELTAWFPKFGKFVLNKEIKNVF